VQVNKASKRTDVSSWVAVSSQNENFSVGKVWVGMGGERGGGGDASGLRRLQSQEKEIFQSILQGMYIGKVTEGGTCSIRSWRVAGGGLHSPRKPRPWTLKLLFH